MGRRIKAGTKGSASQYITRSNAIRRLQLTLQDFRRLCILKGIYPRDPKKKLKGTDKTYFHVKDLKILEHDILLDKYRDIKTHLKKYKKYQGQKEFKKAEEHKSSAPRYTLSHVIKERYPTFIDALRDMDDALCLISLFANFPQHQSLEINTKDTEMAQKLYKEWMAYCTISQCFKKSFYSIKGIYYQVEIMGQNITWVSPYQFNQRLPFDIDYKVIGTFHEFYIALLRFVNFKLYSDLQVKYPPKTIDGVNASVAVEDDKIYLNTNQIQKFQSNAQKLFAQQYQASVEEIGVSEEFKNTPEMIELTKKHEQMKRQRKLFSKCVFLLNREVPTYSLQYLILSFGGSYFTQDTFDELDEAGKAPKVTHHVMDRPLPKKMQGSNVEYVQPQYIVDSINNLFLLPTSQYRPGMAPPPHMSPFVDNEKEGYVPQRQKEIMHLKGEEVVESESESEDENEEKEEEAKKSDVEDEYMSDGSDEAAAPTGKKSKSDPKKKTKGDADSSSEDEDSSDSEMDGQTLANQRKAANAKLKKDLEKEQKELAKVLMSKRQRKLYQKIEVEQSQKKESVKKLKVKRKIIEKKKNK